MREMDSYFDLSDQQYDLFREKTKAHLNWLGKTQIPWLIEEIETLRRQDKPIDPDYLRTLADEKLRMLWLTIADRLSADGALLFKSLSPEQFDYFEGELNEDTEDFIELMQASPEDFQEGYLELQQETMEKMEYWVGSLNDQQKAKIITLTAMQQNEFREEISVLIEMKKEFIRQVKIKVKEGDVEDFLKSWARRPNIEGDRYKIYQNWRFTKQINLWIEMEKMVTPEQRVFRQKKLAEVITDLKTIQNTKF